jgi:glycosyltransferase involved in cell wall biosynthesis
MQAVAIFLPSGVLGGAEQLLVQVAKEYHRRGYEVHFFLLTSIQEKRITDILPEGKLHICRSSREMIGVFLLLFKLFFISTKFRYVYTTNVHLNGFVAFARKLRLLRSNYHIGRESTNIFSRFKKGKRRLMFDLSYNFGYKYIDVLICQTENMKRELIASKPFIGKDKIIVLQNPVTINDEVKHFQNPLPGKQYIVAAGRLIAEKGFDVLIGCMPELATLFPEIELVLLGEGAERNSLESQRNALRLSDRVHLPGWQENVYPYFKYAQACVVSSTIEGFPNVLLQMMMCNDTVIATKCADGIETIAGVYSCEINDAKSLTEQISLALKTNNSEKRMVFDNFLRENTIDKYVKKIEERLN